MSNSIEDKKTTRKSPPCTYGRAGLGHVWRINRFGRDGEFDCMDTGNGGLEITWTCKMCGSTKTEIKHYAVDRRDQDVTYYMAGSRMAVAS